MGKDVKSKTTVQDIGTIDKLMTKGLTASEISEITGKSISGVHSYIRILRFVKGGKPISMNPTRFCLDALSEYAKIKGYPAIVNLYGEKPKAPQPEQTRFELSVENTPQKESKDVLLRIAVALETIAKSLRVVVHD